MVEKLSESGSFSTSTGNIKKFTQLKSRIRLSVETVSFTTTICYSNTIVTPPQEPYTLPTQRTTTKNTTKLSVYTYISNPYYYTTINSALFLARSNDSMGSTDTQYRHSCRTPFAVAVGNLCNNSGNSGKLQVAVPVQIGRTVAVVHSQSAGILPGNPDCSCSTGCMMQPSRTAVVVVAAAVAVVAGYTIGCLLVVVDCSSVGCSFVGSVASAAG